MKGTAANEMKVLLEKCNQDIELLEQQLQDIQKTEMEQRQQTAVSSNPPSTDRRRLEFIRRLPAVNHHLSAQRREPFVL
jgi:hypothetical protein